jgi:hypothetical protein
MRTTTLLVRDGNNFISINEVSASKHIPYITLRARLLVLRKHGIEATVDNIIVARHKGRPEGT